MPVPAMVGAGRARAGDRAGRKRVHDGRPQEYNCAEDNRWVVIGGRTYVADTEGYLMPIQKDEPPPDPKLFQKYFGPKK
jgi:hypothetical protein